MIQNLRFNIRHLVKLKHTQKMVKQYEQGCRGQSQRWMHDFCFVMKARQTNRAYETRERDIGDPEITQFPSYTLAALTLFLQSSKAKEIKIQIIIIILYLQYRFSFMFSGSRYVVHIWNPGAAVKLLQQSLWMNEYLELKLLMLINILQVFLKLTEFEARGQDWTLLGA